MTRPELGAWSLSAAGGLLIGLAVITGGTVGLVTAAVLVIAAMRLIQRMAALAGIIVGFVAGVWLAEYARLGSAQLAWPSTRAALSAVGWSILIEFAAGKLMLATWAGVMVFAD